MPGPFRPINEQLLTELSLETTKVFPLAGAVGRRLNNDVDPRLSGLKDMTPVGDQITYYEHIATVRHAKSRRFYIAFRETMDAFLARHWVTPEDVARFPEWLMKSLEKQAERKVHIYRVKMDSAGKPIVPTAMTVSHEQWLEEVTDATGQLDDQTFDTLVTFLHRNKVIDDAVYAKLNG